MDIVRAPARSEFGIVRDPRSWADSAGHEFWFVPGHADPITVAAATNLDGLSGFGWIATALSVTEGSGADFLSAADQDPTRLVLESASDLLASPRIFGTYDHGLQASRFLGYMPTKLTLEWYGAFTTASAGETTTFVGLAGPAVVDAAAAGSGGAIRSDGTNFFLTSDNGSDAGALISTTNHIWRIEYGAVTTEWFIDNVSQGTITTEADIWPLSFVAFSSTTNEIAIAWLRVFYS